MQCGRPGFNPWVRKISWRRNCQPTPVFLPGESHGCRSLVGLGYSPGGHKESDMTERLHFHFLSLSACNTGDPGLIPGLGRSPGEGNGHPPQYSVMENSMDCIVYGVAESDLTFTHFILPKYLRKVSNFKKTGCSKKKKKMIRNIKYTQ